MNCLNAFVTPGPGESLGLKLPFPIETAKIRLRLFEAGDWKDLTEFEFETDDEATEWLQRQAAVRLTSPDQPFSVAVEDKEAAKVVAVLFLDYSFQQIEISHSISDAAHTKGLDTEAMAAALEFCFQDLRVHRVVARCFDGETESRQLLETAGLKQEAEFRKNFWDGTKWRSTCWFAMLEEEYSQP